MSSASHSSALGDAAWPDTDRAGLLLVPVGSLEQHGPHLPLDTDTCIAQSVTARIAELLGDAGHPAWVGPPLGYGSSGEHQTFSGTVSIGGEALHHVVIELVRSARTWIDRVVLVNAHGGNVPTLARAVEQLRDEGHDAAWMPCRTESTDLHAGRTETSLMLHLRPGSVRLERAASGDTRPLNDILPIMREHGLRAVSPNGVLGDPAGATAAEGAQLLELMAQEIADAITARPVGSST